VVVILYEGPGWLNVHVVTDLDALIRLIRAGRVEIVLASSLNGLGRSVSHLVEVLSEFLTRKVTLIIPSAGIDTSKVPGKVFLDTLDAISEFKRCVAVERISAGLAAAKARGVKLGRPTTVNAHREDVARLRAQGRTGRAIAKELGIPSSTAFKIIGQLFKLTGNICRGSRTIVRIVR
jgi:DNA invertase Pin-like site-specific DNA recombinase